MTFTDIGMKEEWRDIPGYKGYYQVSNLGRVRSLDRVVKRLGRDKRLKGRVLKTKLAGKNRDYHNLALHKEGSANYFNVHKLVALVFLGPTPEGMEVLHGEEGSKVNSVSNLRYGTRAENCQDTFKYGKGHSRPVRRSDGKEFNSAKQAEKLTGINCANISAVCNKYIRPSGAPVLTAGGFSWEFI